MITIKTLPQATAQEVLDQVVTHLLTQNKRAVDKDNNCLYRKGKLKCAAGCFIADDEYDKNMEGHPWKDLDHIPIEHINLIDELQYLHDNSTPGDWYDGLCNISQRRNLQFNPPE